MITKPAKIPERNLSSVDLTTFGGGLFLTGAQIAPKTALTEAKDVELDHDGHIVPRRNLTRFLPATDGISFQKFPVLWNGKIYYFTADSGRIRFCQETDNIWTDCGGTNTFQTNKGGMTKFLRVLDKVLILNGKNGDKLAYIDLADSLFPVTKYALVNNPDAIPTAALTNLSSGAYKVYYAFNYSGAVGETKLSPLLTQSVNHSRDDWSTLTSPGSIEITRTGTTPAGAKYWNVYVAIASSSGTIQESDMLLLVSKIDLATTKLVDNGTLSINLGSVAPIENSTDGPKVDQGIIVDGNPVLFADQDNPYAIWIGGGGPYALDFSISNGGYKAEPEKGTNYYPTTIIGFRSGNGTPALTVLYSNTEGLSKQSVLSQQTVTYGDQSFSVWGVSEQHYGAAGVAAPNSAINYNGALKFLSVDGFMSMETQAQIQNVLSTKKISAPIEPIVRSIKNSAMETVVGTGWSNKYMWLVPSGGFDTPQSIAILDSNNPGITGDGAWYTLDIAANWIGTISPADGPAFVYVSRGKETYKLFENTTTFDVFNGVPTLFTTLATGPFLPIAGESHNSWMASVQAVFYLMNLVGDVEVGIRYRNQSGKIKEKVKAFSGISATLSSSGGWGDTQWLYANGPLIPGWVSFPYVSPLTLNKETDNNRISVRVDDITNEWQWFVRTGLGYNSYKLKAISLEGISLGIKPDLQ